MVFKREILSANGATNRIRARVQWLLPGMEIEMHWWQVNAYVNGFCFSQKIQATSQENALFIAGANFGAENTIGPNDKITVQILTME